MARPPIARRRQDLPALARLAERAHPRCSQTSVSSLRAAVPRRHAARLSVTPLWDRYLRQAGQAGGRCGHPSPPPRATPPRPPSSPAAFPPAPPSAAAVRLTLAALRPSQARAGDSLGGRSSSQALRAGTRRCERAGGPFTAAHGGSTGRFRVRACGTPSGPVGCRCSGRGRTVAFWVASGQVPC